MEKMTKEKKSFPLPASKDKREPSSGPSSVRLRAHEGTWVSVGHSRKGNVSCWLSHNWIMALDLRRIRTRPHRAAFSRRGLWFHSDARRGKVNSGAGCERRAVGGSALHSGKAGMKSRCALTPDTCFSSFIFPAWLVWLFPNSQRFSSSWKLCLSPRSPRKKKKQSKICFYTEKVFRT